MAQKRYLCSMGRVLAIDYGRRRCGIAVTDILRIAAGALPTVRSCDLEAFLTDYIQREQVDLLVVGLPKTLAGEESESMRYIRPFVNRWRKLHPEIPVEMYDERFTSAIAHREMVAGGMKKSRRQEKGSADAVAAVIILTDWLQSVRNTTSTI